MSRGILLPLSLSVWNGKKLDGKLLPVGCQRGVFLSSLSVKWKCLVSKVLSKWRIYCLPYTVLFCSTVRSTQAILEAGAAQKLYSLEATILENPISVGLKCWDIDSHSDLSATATLRMTCLVSTTRPSRANLVWTTQAREFQHRSKDNQLGFRFNARQVYLGLLFSVSKPSDL